MWSKKGWSKCHNTWAEIRLCSNLLHVRCTIKEILGLRTKKWHHQQSFGLLKVAIHNIGKQFKQHYRFCISSSHLLVNKTNSDFMYTYIEKILKPWRKLEGPKRLLVCSIFLINAFYALVEKKKSMHWIWKTQWLVKDGNLNSWNNHPINCFGPFCFEI